MVNSHPNPSPELDDDVAVFEEEHGPISDSRFITVYDVIYPDERRRNDPGSGMSLAIFRLPQSANKFADRYKGEAKVTSRNVTTREFSRLRSSRMIGEY